MLAQMKAFEPPVHIVFGADDPYLNLEVAESFANAFPNSTRIDVGGAHHYVQVDAPAAVAEPNPARAQSRRLTAGASRLVTAG